MSENTDKTIHREFELERMILFSDAVFAIAITLLVIEIKFPELPENYKQGLDLMKMFKPTLKEGIGFLASFSFIGISWAGHLKMFRYLKAYDSGVIFRNLLSLLFIVTFPFTASGLVHVKEGFVFPYIIYLGNLMFVFFSNFLLSHYIFKQKPHLSIDGHEIEKKYIYLRSKYLGIALVVSFAIALTTGIVTKMDDEYVSISFCSFPVFVAFIRRRLKKYKPKKEIAFGD